METFGRQLEKLRNYLGLTQEEFGQNIGIKKSHISLVENDKSSFSFETIQSICEIFKIDARFFFGQLNSIEDADLKKKKETTTSEFIKTIRDQDKEIIRLKEMLESKKDTFLFSESPILNEIFKKIKNWNPQLLKQVESFIKGVDAATSITKNDSH